MGFRCTFEVSAANMDELMQKIITHLLLIIQYQNQQIRWLVLFISKYIPLGQWAHDEIHSPKYQKFKTDILPVIVPFVKQDWRFLIAYYEWKYGKKFKPVQRRNGKTIPEDVSCPLCDAPHHYQYDNNGGNGQYQCKVCGYVYDPEAGIPDQGIAPGTAFEDLPDDWVCPECGAGKEEFSPVG